MMHCITYDVLVWYSDTASLPFISTESSLWTIFGGKTKDNCLLLFDSTRERTGNRTAMVNTKRNGLRENVALTQCVAISEDKICASPVISNNTHY